MNLSKVSFIAWVCFISVLVPRHATSQDKDSVKNDGQPMTPFEKYAKYALALQDYVVRENKTTDKLSEEDLADLPIGIVREISNYQYVIAIDSAYWDGTGWFFSAYASIRFPGSSRPIAFRARRVGFNKGGLSLAQAKLMLIQTQWIEMNDFVLELPAEESNYIEFDCDGFKSIHLKGKFHLPDKIQRVSKKDIPISHGPPGNTPPVVTPKDVAASFEVNLTDVHNFIAMIKMEPSEFQIKGLSGVTFEVKNAVVDLSDFENPPGFSFPAGYQQSFGDLPVLWKGFYLENVSAKLEILADTANKKNTNRTFTIDARGIIIDGDGVSGELSATNTVVPLEAGANVGGWGISLEKFHLRLVQNNVSAGSLGGKLKLPFLGKDPLEYEGEIAQNENELDYRFFVKITTDHDFLTPFSDPNSIGASIRLKPGSTIQIERKDGKYAATAVLNGSLTINDGRKEKNSLLHAKGIGFENLWLSTNSPYIKAPNFSFGDVNPKAMGFSIMIKNIDLKTPEETAVLGFDIGISFADEGKGFSAKARTEVIAKMPSVSNASDVLPGGGLWTFAAVKFNDIEVEGNTAAVSLKGKLSIFQNDSIFGDGFHGNVKMSVKNVMEGLEADVYMGHTEDKDGKDGFCYGHYGLYLPLGPTGIPLGPTLSIRGIIGQFTVKMTPKSKSPLPDFSKLDASNQKSGAPATNISRGSDFIPDRTAGFSLTAGVTIALAANDKTFNGDAILSIAFNEHEGFRYVEFKGTAYFMTSIKERGGPTSAESSKMPLYAEMSVMYNAPDKTFHANMRAYMNLKNKFRGIGPNNMIGEVVMHYDPKDWYIHIGRSSQMLGISIAGLASAESYFMVGTKIEDPPLPPSELRDIADDRDISQMRNENLVATGLGFATGIRFKAGIDKKVTPFYIALSVGAGLDVMIRNYGDAKCGGSNEPIGINGWYASGQAYVFLDGKVGLQAAGQRFDILRLGLAALLQAKLPDPYWMKGQVAGKYSVLGGWITGKFNVPFQVGEECEIIMQGSELGEVVVIEDITPTGNDVSVFTSPQVSFNTSVDTEFSMLNTKNETNSYRVKLDEFKITNNGQLIPTIQNWNAKKDVLALGLPEILPQKATLIASVKVHWEKKLSNGSWESLKDNNNAVTYETKDVTFTTGEAPSFIPEENVSYSYPVKNQYNFLVNEYGQGYVKLRIGQSYLFQPSDDGVKWTYLARFQQPSGSKLEVPISYNSSQSTVNFSIPSEMTKQAVYKLTFIKVPEAQTSVDANLTRTTVSADAGEGNEMTVASNTLEGTLTQNIEKEIYNSAFRTSRFTTFNEKWSSLSGARNLFDVAIGNIAVIGKDATLQETFDEFELNGSRNHHKALVQVSASPDDNWMANTMAPALYNSYPINPSVTITRRNTDSLGIKPLGAVKLYNLQENYVLDETNISSGVAPAKSGPVKVMYYLSYIGFWDFNELRNKAASQFLMGNKSADISKLLGITGYTDLIPGTYKVNFRYTLPGSNQVTSEKQMEIQF